MTPKVSNTRDRFKLINEKTIDTPPTEKPGDTEGITLTEAFFEFKGWKLKHIPNTFKTKDTNGKILKQEPLTHMEAPDGKIYGVNYYNSFTMEGKLPPLHHEFEGLGLQEKWLWPELLKLGIDYEGFTDLDDSDNWSCVLQNSSDARFWETQYHAEAKTKAIAQLKAGLKALGVKI